MYILFTAGLKSFKGKIKLNKKSHRTLYGGYPWHSEYLYCNVEIRLNNSKGNI